MPSDATSAGTDRDDQIKEALAGVRAGRPDAEADLVRLNAPAVLQMARRVPRSAYLSLDDLAQEFSIVVLRCGRSYRPDAGVPWGSYLLAALWRALRKLAAQAAPAGDGWRDDEDGLSYLAWLERLDEAPAAGDAQPLGLLALVDRLPPAERRAVRLRWSMDGADPFARRRTFRQVGQALGVCTRRATALVEAAYARLRDWIEGLE